MKGANQPRKAVVVGATTWGATLATLLCHNGLRTTLLARTEAEASAIAAAGELTRFLPGVPLPKSLAIAHDPRSALEDASLVILAVPSQRFRQNVRRVASCLPAGVVAVSASKGIEMTTGRTMRQVFQEETEAGAASNYCALSGPNLAREIVAGKPASSVIAGANAGAAELAQSALMTSRFRLYTNEDVIGVELAGALKNVVAIGCGIADGLGYGDNAKAAFMTRALAEIARLGAAVGASPLTFAGLAGLGDLVATCASPLSRNRYVGLELAKGRALDDILGAMGNVAEGVYTTAAARKIASDLGVEMPIVEYTYAVLYESLDIRQAIAGLMGRPPRSE